MFQVLRCFLYLNDIIILLFKSGTTGNPKGALLSQQGLLRKFLFKGAAESPLSTLSLIVPCPIFHIWGIEAGVLFPLIPKLKRTAVISNYISDTKSILKAIEKYKCNVMVGNPHHYYDILEYPHFKDYDTSSLMIFFAGGSVVQADLFNQMKEAFNTEMIFLGFGTNVYFTISFYCDSNLFINDII